MRNDMQLKAKIKQEASQIANADRSTAQLLLRNYLTGRMIEKISVSKYRESFIMKGALLLQSRTNELLRTTKDVDFHIDGMNLSEQNLSQVFTDIFSAPTEDGISFDNVHFEPIRKGSEYEGRQMTAMAHFGAIEQSVQADITTGNPVGENAIDYPFPLTLDGRNISIRAYTAEQSAAEKMQTMIARGVDNSRSKDVFDLWLMNSPKMMTPLDGPAVKKAFDTTSVYYGSLTQGAEVTHQLITLASSEKQRSFWQKFKHKAGNNYVGTLTFREAFAGAITGFQKAGIITVGQQHTIERELSSYQQKVLNKNRQTNRLGPTR